MSTDKMPLILEDTINEAMQVDLNDVDDLFGDGVGLPLPQIHPPSKALHQRIDELRSRGCCQCVYPAFSFNCFLFR
jgi:mediator of RNA polymerase II transcription subunit 16, fungi type